MSSLADEVEALARCKRMDLERWCVDCKKIDDLARRVREVEQREPDAYFHKLTALADHLDAVADGLKMQVTEIRKVTGR